MSQTVTIGTNSFIIPNAGENPGWGESLSDYLVAIADALADSVGPNDLLPTTVTLSNNQVSAANIPGLIFNTGEIQAVEVDYILRRIYDSGSSKMTERGKILGYFDGSNFVISTESTGDAEIIITVTNGGIFQYQTSNLANHISSTMTFRAKTLDTP